MGAVPPWTSKIYFFSGGFQAPMGADPPPGKKKNVSPPGDPGLYNS